VESKDQETKGGWVKTMNFIYSFTIALILIFAYAYILKTLQNNEKDLAPNSEYPHRSLFKYFCIFSMCVVAFTSFGWLIGLVLISLSVGVVFTFLYLLAAPKWGEIDNLPLINIDARVIAMFVCGLVVGFFVRGL